jgi:predicted transglutaminase-like cysteine proteinase
MGSLFAIVTKAFGARYAWRRRTTMVTALTLFALPVAALAIPNPLLTSTATSFSDISAFTKWTALMPRYAMQKTKQDKECTGANCGNVQWEKLLTDLKGKSVTEQMKGVNDFFNKITYVTDEDNFGTDDYWQTPYEMMQRGGDCEDYAIAKFISLKRLGVPQSSMRIMIVMDNNLGGQMHAVLEVKHQGKAFLLDNQAKSVTASSSVYHYRPIYAINESNWWAYK